MSLTHNLDRGKKTGKSRWGRKTFFTFTTVINVRFYLSKCVRFSKILTSYIFLDGMRYTLSFELQVFRSINALSAGKWMFLDFGYFRGQSVTQRSMSRGPRPSIKFHTQHLALNKIYGKNEIRSIQISNVHVNIRHLKG